MEIFDIFLVIFLLLAILILFILYKFIFKPKKQLQSIEKQFLQNNWKVLNLGFIPFDSNIRSFNFQRVKTHQDSFYDCKNLWSNYDAVICNFLERSYINLIHPQLAKQFYQIQNQKTFKKYALITRQLERMIGDSVAFSEGPVWKHKRKVMTQFLNFNFIKSVISKLASICKREIHSFYEQNKIQGQNVNGKHVSEIYIQELTELINSTVIAQIFFGGGNQKVDCLKIDGKSLPHFMRNLLDQIFWQTTDPIAALFGVKFSQLGLRQKDRKCNRMLKVFRQFSGNFVRNRLYEIEEQIKKNGPLKQPKDMIEAFYLQVGAENIQKNKTDFIDNLINDFASLYTAGTDTTEHQTMMMIYYINKNPEIKRKLLEEIKENNINIDELSTDSMRNLTYLEAICFQSLRMYQTGNGIFPRQALMPLKIGGVKFEVGSVIATQSFPVHYNAQIYENPNQFRPQRWIDENGKLKNPEPYRFNSFSHGVRSCIGKQLALQEIKLFVVYFSSKYEAQFETLDFTLNMHGFAYEPQAIKMKFWQK